MNSISKINLLFARQFGDSLGWKTCDPTHNLMLSQMEAPQRETTNMQQELSKPTGLGPKADPNPDPKQPKPPGPTTQPGRPPEPKHDIVHDRQKWLASEMHAHAHALTASLSENNPKGFRNALRTSYIDVQTTDYMYIIPDSRSLFLDTSPATIFCHPSV
jgi:hypothetical protein